MIRTRSRRAIAGALTLSLAAFGLAGCSADNGASNGEKAKADNGAVIVDIDGMDLTYTDRDKDASYDEASATKIALSGTTAQVDGEGASVDGHTVTINAEGTYIVSGALSQGQLAVDLPGDNDKAQIVLKGASIHNDNGPALYVKQADKVFLTLADGTQSQLTDGTDYALEADTDEPYSTLFSKDDLTINGSGALQVTASYRHGICSKDDLVITGGTITVQAPEDAMRGRDCVKILDGTFDLTAGDDAIKSTKDTDGTLGFICIDGGAFAIAAGDDAVSGKTAVIANGGDVTVSTCAEGYEAQQVHMNGGKHSITSSDDAINASAIDSSSTSNGDASQAQAPDIAQKPAAQSSSNQQANAASMPQAPSSQASQATSSTDPMGKGSREQDGTAKGDFAMGGGMGGIANVNDDCLVRITGGTIWLDAGGDVIDSNGSIEVTGGTITGCGPSASDDAPMDYELGASVTGGTMLIVGSNMMAEGFTEAEQPFALVNATGAAGSTVELRASDGAILATVTAERAFQCALVTAPELTADTAASLSINDTAVEFTPTLEAQAGGMGMGQGGPAGMGGEQPDAKDGARPGSDGSEPPALPDGEAMDGKPQRPQGNAPQGDMRGGSTQGNASTSA